MYKHWDEWVESIPHPFIADFDGNMMGAATDIMEGEPFEAPMKPFGGIEQLAWSNDSKTNSLHQPEKARIGIRSIYRLGYIPL